MTVPLGTRPEVHPGPAGFGPTKQRGGMGVPALFNSPARGAGEAAGHAAAACVSARSESVGASVCYARDASSFSSLPHVARQAQNFGASAGVHLPSRTRAPTRPPTPPSRSRAQTRPASHLPSRTRASTRSPPSPRARARPRLTPSTSSRARAVGPGGLLRKFLPSPSVVIRFPTSSLPSLPSTLSLQPLPLPSFLPFPLPPFLPPALLL